MDKIGAMQDLIRGIKKVINEYKNPELQDIDENTVAMVKKALNDATAVGNGQYEVNIVKEKLPVWYYGLCILAVVFYSIFRLALCEIDYISLITLALKNVSVIFELLYIIILAGYFTLLFINRKTHKIAKKIFPIIFFLPFYRFIYYLFNYNVIKYGAINLKNIIIANAIFFGSDIIAILVSHLITPRWNLDTSSKSIMDADEKNKQLEKNDFIRKNFKIKEKNKDNKLPLIMRLLPFILVIVLGIITINRVWKVLPFNQGNPCSESVSQILILQNLNVYSGKNIDTGIVASVLENSYFDILDVSEIEVDDNLNPYGFVKIKTNMGIEGYININSRNVNMISRNVNVICASADDVCLSKFTYSNKRDESVSQVEVINETLNLRRDHYRTSSSLAVVKKGDIFTIYDTYVEKVTVVYGDVVVEKRNWYKVKTTNGIEGWICESYQDEIYLKMLEKN